MDYSNFDSFWQYMADKLKRGEKLALSDRVFNKYFGPIKEEIKPVPLIYDWKTFEGGGLPDPLLL